jgi:lipid-A-disaccharide synthase
MKDEPLRVALVAGEASGDLLAGLLFQGMRARWPHLQAHGIGGPKLLAQGFETWWPQDRLAVRGYVEVLRHYRGIANIRRELAERLEQKPPSVFIGVDAPDFNLGLEARLRQRGIKTVHFVCPSIWAWRGGRVKHMAESCDHVLCLFPFEPALLHKHGVAATYVGHPLADVIPIEVPRTAARTSLGLDQSETIVAVLPGSRRSEIAAIAPTFLRAVAQIHQSRPGLRFVLPVAPGLRGLLEPLCQAFAPQANLARWAITPSACSV